MTDLLEAHYKSTASFVVTHPEFQSAFTTFTFPVHKSRIWYIVHDASTPASTFHAFLDSDIVKEDGVKTHKWSIISASREALSVERDEGVEGRAKMDYLVSRALDGVLVEDLDIKLEGFEIGADEEAKVWFVRTFPKRGLAMAAKETVVVVRTLEGEVAGYATVLVDGEGKRVLVSELQTMEGFRRRGVARNLMRWVLCWAKERVGKEGTCWVMVNSENLTAVRLYLDVGFSVRQGVWILRGIGVGR